MNGVSRATPVVPGSEPEAQRGALRIDLSIFAVDAVMRACYKLTNRCHLFIDRGPQEESNLTVTFRLKDASCEIDELLGEFSNELIDQQIRESLAHRAGPIRQLIVAQAFADGNLLDPDREEGDYVADPRGIGGVRGKRPLRAEAAKAQGPSR